MNRNLRFSNLDDAINELKNLEGGKLKTTGRWSFYQILNHCADIIEFSMKGFPYTNLFTFFYRKLFGRMKLKKMLENGSMEPGQNNPYAPRLREDGDEGKAMQRLLKSIEEFRNFTEEFAIHPVYNTMNKNEWELYHSFHIANHLGFVYVVEPAKKEPEKNPKVEQIKEELLKNMSSKLEKNAENPKTIEDPPIEENNIEVTIEDSTEENSEKVETVSPEKEAPKKETSENVSQPKNKSGAKTKKKKAASKKKTVAKKKTESKSKKKAPSKKKVSTTKKKTTTKKKSASKKKSATKKKTKK